jgi:hypothetical protein
MPKIFLVVCFATTLSSQRVADISRAALPGDLTPAQATQINAVIAAVRDGRDPQKPWTDFSASYFVTPSNRSKLETIINGILHDAVAFPQAQLDRAIRDYVRELQTLSKGCNGAVNAPTLTVQRTASGVERVVRGPSKPMTCDALAAEIKKWQEKLKSMGDDAELANVELQDILQRQQQTLQMMSNISKMLYDTATAVIRKKGG